MLSCFLLTHNLTLRLDMSKTLHEYKRFLAKAGPGFSLREMQLANLILEGFQEVQESTSASGKRGRVLAKMIVEGGMLLRRSSESKPNPVIPATTGR